IHLQDLEKKVLCQINNSEFRLELYLLYCDFGHIEALINKELSFYKGVTYLIENSCNIIEKYSLHVGDIITIQKEEEKSYTILRAIFCHKGILVEIAKFSTTS
ncbi:39270_t:CDS:2, partial [Gigaspora margarita]